MNINLFLSQLAILGWIGSYEKIYYQEIELLRLVVRGLPFFFFHLWGYQVGHYTFLIAFAGV